MESAAYYEFRDLEDRHWWFIGRKNIFRELILRLARESGPGTWRSLDLGCGMGGMLAELAAHGEVYGTDFSGEALKHCHGRGYTRVFKATGAHLPLPDASLDLVGAFDTLEHIPEEQETIAECFRILKPGGHLFISVPAYQMLFTHQDRVVHHQRRYTAGGLARKLQAGGFRVRKASYINFLLFPAILPIVLLVKLAEAIRPPSGRYRSNVGIPVRPWLNRVLAAIFSFERHLLRGCSAPAGHSLVAIARKPLRPCEKKGASPIGTNLRT